MEFRELSTDCRNEEFPAKAQRRKGKNLSHNGYANLGVISALLKSRTLPLTCSLQFFFFASLRLCGKLLVLEIHRRNMLADTAAKVGRFHVLGMNRVSIERGAVAKHRYQTCVVRTWQAKRVESNREAFHFPDDRGQIAQFRHVLFTDRLLDIRTVFLHDDMSQHSCQYRLR